jgi:hypothetical protein
MVPAIEFHHSVVDGPARIPLGTARSGAATVPSPGSKSCRLRAVPRIRVAPIPSPNSAPPTPSVPLIPFTIIDEPERTPALRHA